MIRILVAIVIGLALACLAILWIGFYNPQIPDMSFLVPKDSLALSDAAYAALAHRDTAGLKALMEPDEQASITPDVLAKVGAYVPPGAPVRTTVLGWTETTSFTTASGSGDTIQLGRDYTYPGEQVVRARFIFHRIGGKLVVYGLHVDRLTPQQVHIGDFNLAKLTPDNWIYIAIAVAVDTFAFATFVLVITGGWPRWRWRWLWLIASLIGTVRFSYVFVTGKIYFLPLAFLLPPATEARTSAAEPWVLGITIPIGALAYWLMRAQRNKP